MAQSQTEFQIWTQIVTLIKRYNTVLYPIDLSMLLDQLPESGWIVSRKFDSVGSGQTLDELPTKGNTKLRFDQGNKTIGVAGSNIDETLHTYRELMELIRDSSQVAVDENTHYVELRIIGKIGSPKSPEKVLSQWWSAHSDVSDLGTFLAGEMPSDSEVMGQRGLRFTSVGLTANRPNWAELTVYPDNAAFDRRYYFDLLYRNEKSSIAERVAQSANNIITSTIQRLESS